MREIPTKCIFNISSILFLNTVIPELISAISAIDQLFALQQAPFHLFFQKQQKERSKSCYSRKLSS